MYIHTIYTYYIHTFAAIWLQESCQEYLQEDKLKELVQRYSEFINFPIYMLEHRTEEKEVGGGWLG
jgi:HSP90 family molecular chaperone